MKTLLLAIALLVSAAPAFAQDIATSFSPSIEHHDTASPADTDSPAMFVADARAADPFAPGSHYESSALEATARLNGVVLQVQTLPASGTVLISYEMPPQQNLGVLELANARTGQVMYTGSLLLSEGQLELPVPNITEPFEARLATDHNVVIARMTR